LISTPLSLLAFRLSVFGRPSPFIFHSLACLVVFVFGLCPSVTVAVKCDDVKQLKWNVEIRNIGAVFIS